MKQNKFFFICIALICAFVMCSGQSIASEKSTKDEVKQVEKTTAEEAGKDRNAGKQEESIKPSNKEQPKKTERTLFDDDFIDLL